jgi:hypothetical protein
MTPVIRFGLIGLGAGLFLGSVYFSLKNLDLNLLSASIIKLEKPVEEIDLSAPRDSKSAVFSLSKSSAISLPVQAGSKSQATCQVGKSATTSIYINEVAWMGSGSDAKAEWLELKNSGPEEIDLTGWQLLDKTQNIKLFLSGNILPNNFRVFRRGTDFTGTINNSDEVLNLFNSKCELVDKVEATPAWPGGKSDGRTLGRGSDLSWHTSSIVGGTPNAENLSSNSSSTPTSTVLKSTSTNNPTSSNSFGPPPPILGGTLPSTENSKILINEVMVGSDISGSYEFIELYNAGAESVNLSNWSIRKISSTGTDSSLVSKTRLVDVVLPANKFLLLANEKGYVGQSVPDVLWPGSYSLAYKENGINLYDPEGREVDELYWPEIPKNQSYNRASWDSATFKLGSPTPQNSK